MGETAEDVAEDTRFLSRKFILTVLVLFLTGALPMIYKANGVSDTITLSVLITLASIGAAYGFINVKDAKNELEAKVKTALGEKIGADQASK